MNWHSTKYIHFNILIPESVSVPHNGSLASPPAIACTAPLSFRRALNRFNSSTVSPKCCFGIFSRSFYIFGFDAKWEQRMTKIGEQKKFQRWTINLKFYSFHIFNSIICKLWTYAIQNFLLWNIDCGFALNGCWLTLFCCVVYAFHIVIVIVFCSFP